MKRSRFLSLSLVLILMIALLAGCAAESTQDNYNAAGKGEAMAPGLSGNDSESLTGSDVLNDRKLIRKINLTAETEDMDALLSQINQRVAELEGYIEARDIYNGSAYYDNVSRRATLTIRIPANQLDSFVQRVADISNIISNTEESDDVTLQYTATESRLKVLKTEEERLLAFLEEAESISEMLDIEKRLTEVQAQLESLTSQLKVYDNLVDYGTIRLSIDEVEQYTEVPEEDPTMWQQIATGFTASMKNVGNILKGLVVFFITCIPYLLPLAAVGGVVLLILWLRKRRR